MTELAIGDLEAKADAFHNDSLKSAQLRKFRILLGGVADPKSVSILTNNFGRELDEALSRHERLIKSLPTRGDSKIGGTDHAAPPSKKRKPASSKARRSALPVSSGTEKS